MVNIKVYHLVNNSLLQQMVVFFLEDNKENKIINKNVEFTFG